ncbi:MAG: HlyD family efflux transporter periplasmic adaptor subunit [Firmicutes bacterium]|nr:HlyD family efflux transporter periplasmic adaptor subunit [Bacillota bacterium]
MKNFDEYNFNELRESKLIYDRKPPPFGVIMTIFTLICLIGVITLSAFAPRTFVVRATGTITSTTRVSVMPIVSAPILRLGWNAEEGRLIEDGDIIEAGQELFVLNDSQVQAQIDQIARSIEQDAARSVYTDILLNFIRNYIYDPANWEEIMNNRNPFAPNLVIGETVDDFNPNRRSAFDSAAAFIRAVGEASDDASENAEFNQEALRIRRPAIVAPHISAMVDATISKNEHIQQRNYYQRRVNTFYILDRHLRGLRICNYHRYSLSIIIDSNRNIDIPRNPFEAFRVANSRAEAVANGNSQNGRAGAVAGLIYDFYRARPFDRELAASRFDTVITWTNNRHIALSTIAHASHRTSVANSDIEGEIGRLALNENITAATRSYQGRVAQIAAQVEIYDWRYRVVRFINNVYIDGDTGPIRRPLQSNELVIDRDAIFASYPFAGQTTAGRPFERRFESGQLHLGVGANAVEHFLQYLERREREANRALFNQVTLGEFSRTFINRYTNNLENINQQIVNQQTQIAVHEASRENYTIWATEGGILQLTAGLTIGTVVQPGMLLASIISEDDDDLVLETWVDTSHRHNLEIGQSVTTVMQGVIQQDFGNVRGRVIHIDADATRRPDGIFFRVLVEPYVQYLTCNRTGRRVYLSSGMIGDSRIQHDQTTWLIWLAEFIFGRLR